MTDAERQKMLTTGPAFLFAVAGPPATKGSWRAIPTGGRVVVKNDNPRTKAWTEAIGWACKAEMSRHRHRAPATGRVHLTVTCWMRKPDSMDLDKILRAVLDALTGVLYVDDKQVRDIIAQKVGTTEHAEGWPDHVEETEILVSAQDWIEQPVARDSKRANAHNDQAAGR